MPKVPDAAATIRVIPELRQAHVDRLAEMTPAQTIYFGVMYDLVAQPAVVLARRVTLATAVRLLFRTRAAVLEMPEPLWLRFLPRALLLSLAWKLGGLRGGIRRKHVVYALENNSLGRLLAGQGRLPAGAALLGSCVLGLYLRLFVDRIAYGTEGARDLYHSLPLAKAVPHTVVEALPVAVSGVAADSVSATVAFVGSLDARKGLPVLLEAWPRVERAVEGSVLTIVGPGPLEQEVRAWAAESPSTRVVAGQRGRDEVRVVLAETRVLVAPSRLEGRWREQVGLPIVEALAEGCSVVTTSHTGLAAWLDEHGHGVVDEGAALAERLAAEIVHLLERPLDREAVRESLPAIDGRIAADRWLHEAAEDGATAGGSIAAGSAEAGTAEVGAAETTGAAR